MIIGMKMIIIVIAISIIISIIILIIIITSGNSIYNISIIIVIIIILTVIIIISRSSGTLTFLSVRLSPKAMRESAKLQVALERGQRGKQRRASVWGHTVKAEEWGTAWGRGGGRPFMEI